MNGDFTRLTFQPKKNYSSVRLQQGRVQLDADWNEQIDIQAYHDQTTTRDVVGLSGAPHQRPEEFKNFEIRAAGQDIEIAGGRIYVDGILCENEADVGFAAQPDLPGATLPDQAGNYHAHADRLAGQVAEARRRDRLPRVRRGLGPGRSSLHPRATPRPGAAGGR